MGKCENNMWSSVILIFVIAIVLKTVEGTGGYYFYKHNIEASAVLSIPTLRKWQSASLISCSKECILTSGCVFVSYDDVSKTCLLGSADQSAASTINVDVTSGSWVVFVAEGNSASSIHIVNTTMTTEATTSQVFFIFKKISVQFDVSDSI